MSEKFDDQLRLVIWSAKALREEFGEGIDAQPWRGWK